MGLHRGWKDESRKAGRSGDHVLRVAGSESSMTCNVCGFTCFHDPFEPHRGPES